MKIAEIEEYGEPQEVLKIVERDIPAPGDDSVVVKVSYAAVNPVDNLVIRGTLKDLWGGPMPHIPGYDFSGTVHAVGKNVEEFKEGDDVWAVNWGAKRGQHNDEGVDGNPAPTVGGALGEYIELPAAKVSRKPEGVSHALAAAVALVGTTAYQGVENALTDKAVESSTKILILGGSGAVGQLAVQIAKAKGVWVATTCSSRTRDFVETLGADLVIDYTKSNWEDEDALKGIDGVFDTVGDEKSWTRATTSGVLAETGNFIAISGKNIGAEEVGYDPSAHPPRPFAGWFALLNNSKHQDALAQLLVEGKLKLAVDEEFPFTKEGIVAALKKQAGGKSIGKNVVKIAT